MKKFLLKFFIAIVILIFLPIMKSTTEVSEIEARKIKTKYLDMSNYNPVFQIPQLAVSDLRENMKT